jgi:endonuclease/exonuclease/phosphatase (EEP) superfamily protein YafD
MSSRDDSERRPSFIGSVLYRWAWLILLTGYAAAIPAGCYKDDFQSTGGADAVMGWISMLIKNYVFHLGLVIAVVAGLAILFRRIFLPICTLPLLILCLSPELRELRKPPPPAARGEQITVMTFNLFDANVVLAESGNGGDVVSEIERAAPDVLFLQEYTDRWHQALHESLKSTFPHFRAAPRDHQFGIAIYSRRPFCDVPQEKEAQGKEALPSKSTRMFKLARLPAPQLRAAIKLADQEVAIYNIHLYPPVSLDCATANRRQFDDLLNRLKQEKLPAIVGGDFNFTQRSAQGRALDDAGWVDAHFQAGKGRGGTWSQSMKAQWLPRLRYDHIYLSRRLACVECRTGEPAGSDHLPVIAKIGFEADPPSGQRGD